MNLTPDISKHDLKLILIVSIRLSSKLFEASNTNSNQYKSKPSIHESSGNIFNNHMLKKAEQNILTAFDYDLFIREYLLVDRLGLYLEAIKPLVKKGYFTKFKMYISIYY